MKTRNACYNWYMADLNIRNVSPELIAKLKSNAALNGCTLRDYCIIVLAGWQEPPKPFDWKAKLAETGLKPAMFGGRMEEPPEHYTNQHDRSTCRIYRCGMCAAAKQA